MEDQKKKVLEFWDAASCGEELYLKGNEEKERFRNQMDQRYRLEPFILDFAKFEKYKGKKVLEVGVGLGADHQKFAEGGADLYGIDLTPRAVEHSRNRLKLFGLTSHLSAGDAENMPFTDNDFDLVYSWGVIHHSPNTPKCVYEIHRVLKKDGECRVMIYHKRSMVGYMLWIRYALFRFKPWLTLNAIYSSYLESPGTKAYTIKEAKELFKDFRDIRIETLLGHGDLLSSQAGQRHRGFFLTAARVLFPRLIIKKVFPRHGLFMLITGRK